MIGPVEIQDSEKKKFIRTGIVSVIQSLDSGIAHIPTSYPNSVFIDDSSTEEQ
jgi:hypothetical protein